MNISLLLLHVHSVYQLISNFHTLLISYKMSACPIARLWIRLPHISQEARNSLIIRLIQKKSKLNKLRLSFAQTPRHDTAARASLSEAIWIIRGSIRELKILLTRSQPDQYILQPGGPFIVHSCPNQPTVETIDLTDSDIWTHESKHLPPPFKSSSQGKHVSEPSSGVQALLWIYALLPVVPVICDMWQLLFPLLTSPSS